MSAAVRYDPGPLPEQCDTARMDPRHLEHACHACRGTGTAPGFVSSRLFQPMEPDICPRCYGRNPPPGATCMWSGRRAMHHRTSPHLPARYGTPVTLAGYRRGLPLQPCEVSDG